MKSLALVRVLFSLVLLATSLFTPIPAQSSPIPSPARWEAPALRAPAAKPAPAFVPDRLIVQFQPGVQSQAWEQERADSLNIYEEGDLPQPQILGMRPLLPSPSANTLSDASLQQIYLLDLAPGSDVLGAAAALSKDPAVLWAEPDYLAEAAAIPSDPLYPQQWGLDQISAPDAWEVVTGTQTVVIAVLDSGIEFSHADFAGRLWTNPGEIAANGLDDDNNGYVDDLKGWDFVNGDNNPADDNGHGTQAAGIAAAAGNDGTGIAGVCWNCKILPLKVMQVSGVANYSDITAGIWYAAQKGARVINLSLGGYSYSNAMRAAVQAAVNTYSVVLVGGAGNDNLSTPFYPAAYDEVIAVAGTTETDAKAAFSDYGEWVDLCAPSVNITTTYLGGDWGPANGTSFAAPFVSGLAALIRTQHPDWSPAVVKAQMERTADPIDALNPGYAGMLGSGRINAGQAILVEPHPILSVESTAVDGDPLGRPTPGESAALQVTLANEWWLAQGVTGTLTTTDPLVTITADAASFGDLLAGGAGSNSPDFTFGVDIAAGYNRAIPFLLKLIANGSAYTIDIPFTIYTRSGEEPFLGVIIEDTSWTSDKTYLINGDIGVAPGVTLTIQPGTEVRFNGNYSLIVGGTLIADGSQTQPIRFLSNISGATWGRIYLDDMAVDAISTISGTYISGNILRWINIESASQGIGCFSATPYLSHVTTNMGGLDCTSGSTSVWLLDSDVTGNVTINGMPSSAWKTRTSMPTARGFLGVAMASNGKIYAIGGVRDTVEEYDLATNIWTTRASMPTARAYLGVAAASNGKIYAVGGDNGGYLTTVEEYNPATDTWVTCANMPTYRSSLGLVAASNGKIYAIGGVGNGYLDVVEEYDPATDTWTTRASMPTPRVGLGVAESNGKIYAIGGYDGMGVLATVEEYDPAADTWTTRADLPTPRYFLGVTTASNGKIYAIGGSGGDNVVEEYDPATNTWATRVGMPTARYGLGVAAGSSNNIYAIGGSVADSPLATVEEFDTTPSAYVSFNVWNTTIRSGNLDMPKDTQVLNSIIGGSITIANNSAGYSSLVQNTTAGGAITLSGEGKIKESFAGGTVSLDSGEVSQTTVTGGGISIGSGEVLSNTIRSGGISAGNGSTVRGNNIENNSGWGITTSGSVTVEKNRLVGNAGGIYASGGTIQGNLIANSAGVGIEIRGNTVAISNTLHGNGGSAIKLVSGTTITITGNNLEFNKGAYDIENLILKTTLMMVPAQGNWWGTTSNATIAKRIFDNADDTTFTVGQVLYAPAASGPIQSAPAYVRGVTVLPESPVGIETMTVDVVFSRPMETDSNPQVSFRSVLNDSWTVYNTSNSGLPSNDVRAIAVDPDGSLWFGTWGGGVAHFDGTTWTVFNSSNSGLPGNAVHAISTDPDGSHWFGTDMDGVAHFDGATWTTYNTNNSGLPGIEVYAIAADPDGSHWFGTASGVAHFDGNNWTVYNTSNSGLPDNQVYAIATDLDGSHWFGTGAQGAVHFDGTTWKVYNSGYLGQPPVRVDSIIVDPDGSKWFGSNGAMHFDGKNWVAFNTDNSGIPANNVLAIVTDPDGSHWFATGGQGAAHYNGATWTVYNTGNAGLPHNTVFALAKGQDGSHWFGTMDGLGVLWAYPRYEVLDHPTWLNENHYQASYEVTALVPKDAYTVTVSSAWGADGIQIVPHTDTSFSVDYAGAISDITPPLTPVVSACAANTPDQVSAQWSASDPDGVITLYQIAIGATQGGIEVVNWTNTSETTFSRSGLSLTRSQTYYISVRARNAGGLWSQAASVPVIAGSGMCSTNQNFVYLPLARR